MCDGDCENCFLYDPNDDLCYLDKFSFMSEADFNA